MKLASLFYHKGYALLLILALYLLVYFQAFTTNYAYLDEIHQLWNNKDGSNLLMFLDQGRWLTGLLFDKFFRFISTIEQLKLLRLFSLGGWVFTTWLWTILFTRWVQLLGLKEETLWLGNLFVVCSASVAICIGFASCMEIFLATGFALLAGHLLFTALLTGKQGRQLVPATLLSISLGIVSLFLYQTAYGAFVLPFFFYFVKLKGRFGRPLLMALGTYLVTYVAYYFLFKYSLQVYGVAASTRTGISLDVLGKIGFFFSGPMPQAFSLNWLYSSSSIVSQVLYIGVFILWVVSVFKENKVKPFSHKTTYLVGILFLLALIYLPLMIAKENFSSYRTLFAVNLAAFVLVMEDVLALIHRQSTRKRLVLFLTTALLITGIYNYNLQFVNPVEKEYAALSTYFRQHYTADKLTIHFIRADRKLFNELYGTRVIKDEFGAPSSSRDWVPGPLIRQLVTEMTGSRGAATRIRVIQYQNQEQYRQAGAAEGGKSLVMDANAILRAHEQKP